MISRLSDENIDRAAKQSMADQEKMHQRANSSKTTLHSKIKEKITNVRCDFPSACPMPTDEDVSAILKEVYEEVEKALPEKEPEEEPQPLDDQQGLANIAARNYVWGFNRAINEFKSNLKLMIEGKE